MIEISGSTLSVALVPEKNLKEYSRKGSHVLAVIHYGRNAPGPLKPDCLEVTVPLPQIEDDTLVEVWTSDLPHEVGELGNISYAANADFVFGSLKFHESATDSLERISFRAYQEILEFIGRKEFSNLVRCWNYFPDINLETNGVERYKQFCAGRFDAFAEKYKTMHRHLPAGSAVGSENGPLTINFIATRNQGVKHIENPRQVSAYQYPKEYGNRSPSFARATCMDWREGQHIYVAGTASIVGHESCHRDDPTEQINEIHRNLDSLLDQCGFILDCDAEKEMLITKTYLRDQALLPLVKDKMEKRLGGGERSSLYLVGDICRKELLLEVEGVWVKNTSASVSGKNTMPRSEIK
jgi:chorismate lyase/3-hydroxybenzoate synthase